MGRESTRGTLTLTLEGAEEACRGTVSAWGGEKRSEAEDLEGLQLGGQDTAAPGLGTRLAKAKEKARDLPRIDANISGAPDRSRNPGVGSSFPAPITLQGNGG